MMYYRRALKLQAFLDMATENGNNIINCSLKCLTKYCWSCEADGSRCLAGNNIGVFLFWTEILAGYKAITVQSEEDKKIQRSLYAQLEAVADMKFTYVATCQNYGNQKRSGDRRATDILNLMVKYVHHLITLELLLVRSFCLWIWDSISVVQ